MPIYEYKCPEGHVFECVQRMSDPPVVECEVCGAGPVERVLYPVAVHFKGSGFYTTDYGRGSRRSRDGSSGESGGAESSGSSAGDSGAAGDSGGDSGGTKKPPEKKTAEA
jgi:putative FmdB family regulatory protein